MVTTIDIDRARELLSVASASIPWKTLTLLLAIVNLKNLPFIWHLRILRHFWGNIRWKTDYPYFPKGTAIATHTGKPTHPVFTAFGITSRTPMWETDYNFHKSNSTYFSDLDVARTALVTRLYSPGVGLVSKELDAEFAATARKEGKKPPASKAMYIALGSVYCNFKREIKPFEKYEIESKTIAWDQKWMYVMSFFLRPAPRKGGQRVLFATALSKYVAKKGRLTVSPERVMRASGFLPPRPEGLEMTPAESSADGSGVGTPAGEGITASAAGVDGSLVREVLQMKEGDIPERATLEKEATENAGSWDAAEWTWERIEEERQRGLRVVEGYASLDAKLLEEWER